MVLAGCVGEGKWPLVRELVAVRGQMAGRANTWYPTG
jgi:hypothetical protein